MHAITLQQGLLLSLIGTLFIFLIWGRYRYDLVAFGALLIAYLVGAVSIDEAFSGFGHPAVIIIALVLMRPSHRAVPKWRGGGRPQPSPGVRVLVKEVQAPQFKRQARAAAIHGREVREPPRAARADDDAARLMHKAARSLRRAEVETEARRRARACAKTSRARYSHFGQRRGGWRWPRRPWCRRRRRSRL